MIENLDLSKNKMTELESKIFTSMKNLLSLDASKNYVKLLSCKINHSAHLEKLILDDNNLEVLPSEIG